MLSGLSNCAGLVVAPKSDSPLRHIEFVSLAQGRALVVLVTEDGSVENRIVEVPAGMPASAMTEATNFLSARMVGKTIEEAQRQLAAELEAHRRDLDDLTQKLVEAGMATATGEGAETALIVSGTERLLDDVQAVEDLERVRTLYDALDTKESWFKLLDAARDGEGVKIFIGSENDLFSVAGCSVVVAPYRNSEQENCRGGGCHRADTDQLCADHSGGGLHRPGGRPPYGITRTGAAGPVATVGRRDERERKP